MTNYIYRRLATADANIAVINAGQTDLTGWSIHNTAGAARYVKLYNKATAPTASDTPAIVIALAANGSATFNNSEGLNFSEGLGIRIVTGVADNDATAPSANDVVVNIFYY